MHRSSHLNLRTKFVTALVAAGLIPMLLIGSIGERNASGSVMLVTGFLILLAIAAVAWFLARSLTKPITALSAKMRGIAESGDLTERVDDHRGDEIGALASAFNRMIGEFEKIIARVGDSSAALTESAERSTDATSQARTAVDEIGTTIDAVAAGAGDQASTLQDANTAFFSIGQEIEQVAQRGLTASAAAAEADVAARGGSETLAEAAAAMDEIRTSVDGAAEVVTSLGARSEAIGEIVETISAIAEQTNLLALNAAIEAARAGEQGRGFAVVADEVRKLAEEFQSSATSIEVIIRSIQNEKQAVVTAIETGTASVEAGTARMGAASEAFAAIRARVAQVTDEVTGVSGAVEVLTGDSVGAQAGIAQAASVSQQNAAAAEEVSAATRESTSSVEVVASTAEHVSEQARDLQRLVQRFRVRDDEPGASQPDGARQAGGR